MKLRAIFLCLLIMFALVKAGAQPRMLRYCSYNIDCADQSSDNNLTNPATLSLPTVIKGMGLHHIGTNAQPVDLLSCEEDNGATLSNFVVQLNLIYGSGTYTNDKTTDLTTGGGTDGLIYNTKTVQVISARSLPTGQTVLLQPNLTYVNSYNPGGGTKFVTRGPMVYQIRPAGYASNFDFYIYVCHARSSSDDSLGDGRYAEAQEVRSDAKYNLPAGSHIIYSGDWNLFAGSYENAYRCLTGQTTSDGTNWADNAAVCANTNQTQAYDPTSKTSPPTTTIFTNSSVDNANYLYDDSTDPGTYAMGSRLDIQLPNALMFAAYNSGSGVRIASAPVSPYDTSNFPSSQYPYAFEVFGNNGTVPIGSPATNAANHSLDDLASTVPNAATVYKDIELIGSGTNFTGSDHYPIVSDYTIFTQPPAITNLTFTNKVLQFTIAGGTGIPYAVEVNTNITVTNWVAVVTNTVPYLYKDTNSLPQRFYRIRSVP